MERMVLVMTFMDEGGKARRLSVSDAKRDLQGGAVKAAAQTIVDSGAFSVKGKFVAAVKGQLVATTSTQLFAE